MADRPEFASPFGPNFDFSKMFESLRSSIRSTGPIHWDTTKQVAQWVALAGQQEAEIKRSDEEQLVELAHAAQMHVAQRTGLAAGFKSPVHVIGRSEWVELNLVSLKPTLEQLASSLQPETAESGTTGLAAIANAFGELQRAVGPVVAGMQAGVMVGYLAHHMLGQHDLSLPCSDEPRLAFLVPNMDAFQNSWSLKQDDFRFFLAIHEATHAAVMSLPWVRGRLVELVQEYVTHFQADPAFIQQHFGNINPNDPASIQALAQDPNTLLGAMQSPIQRSVLKQIQDLTATVSGYADLMIEQIGSELIPTFGMVQEAMRRHRVDRGSADRFVGQLLGLELSREHYERGAAFAQGVVERSVLESLNRLWENDRMLPTSPELDAPGLWLARIELESDNNDSI